MLSESVLSVRKELFPQNKTAVSDMPKVNIQKKVQPTDADMVQTSLSFENIYYSLWEIAGRYSSFCQFRVIGNSHDERMIPMLEVGTGAQMIFCVAGINGTQALLPELLLKMAGEYCRAYECGWKLDEFYEVKKLLDKMIEFQAPNKTESSKKHISTQRYGGLYSIGVMPFSLSGGLSKLYHVMKSSICCINSVSVSGTNNSKDSLLR